LKPEVTGSSRKKRKGDDQRPFRKDPARWNEEAEKKRAGDQELVCEE
jgi:hypothetical protein